jgi:hypothetical protein
VQVVPVYVMKTYRGRWGTSPFILNLGESWIWVGTIKPWPPHSRDRTLVSNVHEAGWASDQIRTFWRPKKYLNHPKIQMPDHPACRTYNSVAGIFNTAYKTSPWLQPYSFCSHLHEYERLLYLIFVWPYIIETNSKDNQLDATIMVY